MTAATLAMAMGLAVVHLLAGHLRLLQVIPRSWWLSLAGGASVAYVFVHILPELHAGQRSIDETEIGPILGFIEHHVYLVTLVGFSVFYGLERLAKTASARASSDTGTSKQQPAVHPTAVFWVHIGAFALYNGLVGYLLLHREGRGLTSLLLFTAAMALHFFVNDHGMRDHHRTRYDHLGRWLLSAAVIAGWVVGLLVQISDAMVAVYFGLLAGGVILNVIKEELPSERQSRFWPFALGAGAYAALLLIA